MWLRSHYSFCYCAVYDECKYSDTFWLADRTRLCVQYTTSLSSLCKLIGRHWTYKMPVRCILSSVWVRLSIFSPLSIIQYVGLYVFSLPISLVMIERIYKLCLIIIVKSEAWTITHCLGLGHDTVASAVCLSIFLLEHFFEKIRDTKLSVLLGVDMVCCIPYWMQQDRHEERICVTTHPIPCGQDETFTYRGRVMDTYLH